jgi:hypothetical protein
MWEIGGDHRFAGVKAACAEPEYGDRQALLGPFVRNLYETFGEELLKIIGILS